MTILEQDPASERSSRLAGLALGASVTAFLAENDDTKVTVGIPSQSTIFAWYKWPKVLTIGVPRELSSWGLLYRILRANYDGLASVAVANPPPPRKGDGATKYVLGKKVTGLRYDAEPGTVDVQFVDVSTGEESSITAELVLGADGINSTVRKLVQGPAAKEYSGYVAWRATVPERLLSKETVAYFSNRFVASMMNRTYMMMLVTHRPLLDLILFLHCTTNARITV